MAQFIGISLSGISMMTPLDGDYPKLRATFHRSEKLEGIDCTKLTTFVDAEHLRHTLACSTGPHSLAIRTYEVQSFGGSAQVALLARCLCPPPLRLPCHWISRCADLTIRPGTPVDTTYLPKPQGDVCWRPSGLVTNDADDWATLDKQEMQMAKFFPGATPRASA